MSTSKRSIQRIAQRATTQDRKARERAKVTDSFQNFAANLGIGTDNLMSASGYGFNPVSRNRTLLEWIHRGSWLGGVAVDVVAEDMTKMGVDIRGDIDPDDIEEIQQNADALNLWNNLNDVVKWSRLYGGSLGVMTIDGQKMDTPLRLETVGKGQFKGIMVLDRWMVEPSLNDLVTEYGPDLGNPKYYYVTADAPAFPRMKIHYSRCLRMEGVRLPYWQRLSENLWGISVLERLYDRMVAFDSATTGAAQLLYKAYLRTYKIENMREIVAAGGPAQAGLVKYVDMMRRFQSQEGVTLLDAKDDMVLQTYGFAGISDMLLQFGQQLSGALQIPLVRLFGQSPAGLNATGESDLRMYYDGIKSQQESTLKVPLTNIYRAMAQSLGIKLPSGFTLEFRPLWQLTDVEKVATAAQLGTAVESAFSSAVITRATAMKELRQGSKLTGVFTNITDEDIKAAEEEPPPGAMDLLMQQQQLANPEGEEDQDQAAGKKKTQDAMLGDLSVLGFPVVLEHAKGEIRFNPLPAAYGYIRRTNSAEPGDQLDCFVGPDLASARIFIIDSYEINTGRFDEHKVMLRYASARLALHDFTTYYSNRTGQVTEVSQAVFAEWIANGDMSRPYLQPTDVQYTPQASNVKERCKVCKFYADGWCSNPLVRRDPTVPQVAGQKYVSITGWCKEFASE
jgi:phage-related protein (TIGR01555 family)